MNQRNFSLTATQQQGLTDILTDVALLTAPFLSLATESFRGYERLVHKPKFWVGRIALANSPAGSSVIVKHVPPEHYPPDPQRIAPALREEQLVYQFLTALRPEFDRLPHLWGWKPGLLVLEDLEPMRQETSAEERLVQLADTLARLHTVCGREQNLYHRLRQEAGLTPYTGAGYPSAELWFGFLEGMRELKTWCDLLALPTPDWAALIQTVRQTLQTPGPFLTLIHSEQASSRNAFSTSRGVYLLDFEQASLGHALIDIAIAMVGHVEWKVSEQGYFLNHLSTDMAFADLYRHKWETLRGEGVPDTVWQKELSATFLFIAGLAVGSAVRAETKFAAVQPFVQTLGEVLRRLTRLLQQLGCLTEWSLLFAELETRLLL